MTSSLSCNSRVGHSECTSPPSMNQPHAQITERPMEVGQSSRTHFVRVTVAMNGKPPPAIHVSRFSSDQSRFECAIPPRSPARVSCEATLLGSPTAPRSHALTRSRLETTKSRRLVRISTLRNQTSAESTREALARRPLLTRRDKRRCLSWTTCHFKTEYRRP